jgi:hypothetical protein
MVTSSVKVGLTIALVHSTVVNVVRIARTSVGLQTGGDEMSWVLIVIVSFGLSHTTGGTVTNVAGYQSKQSCEQAAKEMGRGHLADVHITTVCIPGPEK